MQKGTMLMKRKTKNIIIAFTVLIIVISVVITLISLSNRNLGNKIKNYGIEVFVPDGLADKYKDLIPLSLESWEIYEYKLDNEEIKAIEKELDNGYWTELEKEDSEYFLRDYFYPPILDKEWQKDFQLSDEVYVSSYAGYQKPYHYSETSVFDNLCVFVYDKESSTYYGIYVYLGR